MTLLDKPGTFIGKVSAPVSGIFFVQIIPVESGIHETVRCIGGLNSANALTSTSESISLRMAETSLSGPDTLWCTKTGLLRKRVAIELSKDSFMTLYMYPESLSIAPSAYPVIDGSTSTQPVGIVLAATVLGTTYGYADQDDGSKKMVAFSASKPALADSINTLIVKHNSTHDAYVNVIRGTAGIGLIARSPSPDEIALAESLNVKLEVIPFALDAFVFLVNRKNPVESISLQNIRQIYSGGITNWTSLGGPDLKIRPYQREKNSGSQEMMVSLVMKETPLISSTDMVVFGMMGPYNVLNNDTAGIGYTVYFYGKNMAPEQFVKFLPVDGVAATSQSIGNHTYPLWADVYMVSRADLDPTSNAACMRELILSPKGQEIIERCGYVPVWRD
jgi:phosphate transport system substrate-binding protein